MEYIIYGLYYIKKLRYIILLMILIGIVVLLDKAVKAIKRRRFSKRYGIDKLPKSITITRGNKKEQNYYKLKYPYWKNSKKDGTADLRVKENKIIWFYVNRNFASRDFCSSHNACRFQRVHETPGTEIRDNG